MEQGESIFCHHCNENVSRSTYRRHQLHVSNLKRKHIQKHRTETSESDSDIAVSPSKHAGKDSVLLRFNLYVFLNA